MYDSAEQLHEQLHDHSFATLKISAPVTVSCGVAVSHSADTPYKQLHSLADKRMYQAKAIGRNQVISQG